MFKLWRIVHMFDPIEQEVAVNPLQFTFLPTARGLVKHELRFVCFNVNWAELWGGITDELENYGFRIDCILFNKIYCETFAHFCAQVSRAFRYLYST